jgi:hypothetical protein
LNNIAQETCYYYFSRGTSYHYYHTATNAISYYIFENNKRYSSR